MIGKLLNRVTTAIAVHRLEKMPLVQAGRAAIDKFWISNAEVTKDFSADFVQNQSKRLMEEIIDVATSPDPRMANQEKLAAAVIEYARFQVLVIAPPPEVDPTGFRGQYGVTGQLKAHLLDIAQKEKGLREFMHSFETPKSWDDVWDPVLMRYRVVFAWVHVFHTLRFALDDVNHAEGKDWFKPFAAVMCGWWEHQYRTASGLPVTLAATPLKADMRSLMLGTFPDCVLEGVRYPDLEWNDRVRKVEGE